MCGPLLLEFGPLAFEFPLLDHLAFAVLLEFFELQVNRPGTAVQFRLCGRQVISFPVEVGLISFEFHLPFVEGHLPQGELPFS